MAQTQSMYQGLSKEQTQQAVVALLTQTLTALSPDPLRQAALLAALAPAAQDATVRAVLAKLPQAPALDSSLSSLHVDLLALTAKLPTAPALDETLQSILAKLPVVIPVSAMWRYSSSLTNGTSTVRPTAAGQKHYITGIQMTNSTSLISVAGSLLGVTITVSILDGTAVIWSDVFAAGSKSAIVFGQDAPLPCSANSTLTVVTSAPGILANVQGYTV